MHVFPLNRPLCPRLQMVADFVRDGAAVADIGTDHAYLPVALVLSGKCLARLCPICVKCRWKMRVRQSGAII